MHDASPVIPTEADWSVRTVGEMTTLLRRGTAPVYVDDSPVRAIGQRCVTDRDFDGSRSRPHSARAMSKVLRPEFDDLLINSTGTGTIGRSVIFRDSSARYIVDGHVTVARPRQSELLARWLNDVLRSPAGQRYLEANCYAGSTNQVELSSLALSAMPVALPEIGEQRGAAEVLDALDDQIRFAERILGKLRTTRTGLLEGLIAKQAPNSTLASSLLGQPANGIYKPAHLIGRGALLVGQTAVDADRRVVPSLARRAVITSGELRRFSLISGDLLVSRVFATLDGVGQPALVEPLSEPGVYESNMMRLRLDKSKADPFFVFQTLLTNSARAHVVRRANLSNQASISQAVLSELPLWLPSIEQQHHIGRTIRSVEAAIGAEQSRLSKLRAVGFGLRDDLLTGRIRVPTEVA